MDTATHADRLVAEAVEADEALFNEIQKLRVDRKLINVRIAELSQERKPLQRIINAARGRQVKEANGDAGGSE